MRSIIRLSLALLAVLVLAPLAAAQQPGIAWAENLPGALRQAKAEKKILMVCVNAKRVDGRREDEPAAKGLREVVYKDPQVVARSREFVCVLLTKEGTSAEYDALRELGIDGEIISPQHIFISPDGGNFLHRREYWSFGQGEMAVKALLTMMDKAQKALAEQEAEEAAAPGDAAEDDGPAPPDGEARQKWIEAKLARLTAPGRERDAALAALVDADADGDCTGPLIALLPEHEKDVSTLWALIRALGRDGLEAAALPIAEYLTHKDDAIKANAAVSLEYIGSRDKKVIAALRKLATKSKDEAIANHAFRALGRCGVEDNKVRSLLLDEAGSAKSEFASYGPCIGLAYFEGDEKAMRGVEKLLKQIGVPGSRRGGGGNTVKRGLVSWTLASIGDAKSAEFIDEELVGGLKNVKAFWVGGLVRFWETCAEVCEDPKKERLPEVEAGVRRFVQFSKGANLERFGAETGSLMDGARKDRKSGTEFVPKGDDLLDTGDEEAGDMPPRRPPGR